MAIYVFCDVFLFLMRRFLVPELFVAEILHQGSKGQGGGVPWAHEASRGCVYLHERKAKTASHFANPKVNMTIFRFFC